MGIPITAGFDVKSPVHLDRRQAMTKAEMLNLPKGILPPYFFIQCLDDGQLYIYDESIEPGPTGSFILATNMNGTEARKSIPSTGEYSDGAIIQYVGETTGKWKRVECMNIPTKIPSSTLIWLWLRTLRMPCILIVQGLTTCSL